MSVAQTSSPSIMASVVQASRKWRKLAQLALAAHGISQARASALVWVQRLGGGTRQNVLASYIGIEGTSLVRLLDELASAGLVVRKDDPCDRRAKNIWLTPEGDCLASQIEKVLAALGDRVLVGINEHDLAATLRICEAIELAGDVVCNGTSSAAVDNLLVSDIPIELRR